MDLPAAPRGTVRLFGWVRLRQLRVAASELLHQPAKLAVLAVAWGGLFVGVYALAYRGLKFISDTAGIGAFLLERLWYLFLFVVMALLFISQMATCLSTIIRSTETWWWRTLPVPVRSLGRAKWLESSFYSSWAVLLLLAPIVCAHLVLSHRGLWLLGWMGFLALPMLGIVTALATLVLLLGVRSSVRWPLPRGSAAALFVAACALIFWLLGERAQEQDRDAWFLALQEVLPRMRVAMAPVWPSSWVATALADAMNGRWTEAWMYAALLWTTAAVAWRALDHVMAWQLNRVLEPPAPEAWRGADATCSSWGHPLAAMLRKDVLLAGRDPMLWSQALVFFGLLGAYFANIHRLARFSGDPSWRLGLASLNLACTLLVLGSLAVRFVFPQPSLEGRALWLLRMVPRGIAQLLRAKLWFYGAAAAALVEGLLWLSMARLDVPGPLRGWLLLIGLAAAWTIVAITVGLGAWWADPSATDAARVVSSSRGAMALVGVLVYVGLVIAALLAAWAGWAAHRPWETAGAAAALGCLSAAVGWWLVRRGAQVLAEQERVMAGSV